MASKLNPAFFDCASNLLAEKLLGKYLCIQSGEDVTRHLITETEAYGLDDSACHCYKGKTKRNDPMYKAGGTVYVYLCYSLHEILNISAGKDGEGQAVMIRGIDNTFGPGKVTKTLGVDRSFNYEFLPTSNRIWVECGIAEDKLNIERLKRIGIGYATQHDQDKPWRFKLNYKSNV